MPFAIPFDLDAVMLARIQFAFTISFHIIFPAFTIGLASWLAVVEWRWLKTDNKIYEDIYRQWVKVFAVCFGMGVVSGVVLSYQFGTNWSVFSDNVGNVIGPLLAYEVLTAFFLEASFLGVMLFGMDRVSRKMHFTSTVVVAVGTLISAFWILSANSWMQTPQGYEINDLGIFFPTNWLEVIFNPSFPYRLLHMVMAAYLTTAFVVAAVASYYFLKGIFREHAKVMLGMAMIMAVFVAPLQLVLGHAHGENTLEHQPIKVAAMEGNWERGGNKPLYLLAHPDEGQEKTHSLLSIPNGASFVLTWKLDGVVPGLKEVPASERPPVGVVFWSFRIMVGLGMLMILTGVMALLLYSRGKLFEKRWFFRWCVAMGPAGFIAVLAGWFVTEVGRQPYTVYGVLRTTDSISPVAAEQVALTLLGFIVAYTFIFGAGTYYVFRLFKAGPKGKQEKYYRHTVSAAPFKDMPQAEKNGGNK